MATVSFDLREHIRWSSARAEVSYDQCFLVDCGLFRSENPSKQYKLLPLELVEPLLALSSSIN